MVKHQLLIEKKLVEGDDCTNEASLVSSLWLSFLSLHKCFFNTEEMERDCKVIWLKPGLVNRSNTDMSDDENMSVSGQNTTAGTEYQHYYHPLWSEFIIELALTLSEWLTNSLSESYLELWGVSDVVVEAIYINECYLSCVCLSESDWSTVPSHSYGQKYIVF